MNRTADRKRFAGTVTGPLNETTFSSNMKTKYIFLIGLLWGLCSAAWADLNTDLQHAAKAGDVETIQRLIKQGADPSYKSKKGNTTLALAYSDEVSSFAEDSNGDMSDLVKNDNMIVGEYLSVQSNEISEQDFQDAAKQAFVNARWSVVDFSPGKVFGILKRGTFKTVISFDGKDVLVRFLSGYRSNQTVYLRNLVRNLSESLGLEFVQNKRNFVVFLDLGKTGIAEDQIKSLGAAAMRGRGWTVTEGASKIYGEITRSGLEDDLIYKCETKYSDGEVSVRFVDGYGSDNPSYLRNIQVDLGASLELKRAK